MKKTTTKKGFTLVELLVVTALIAMLATIILASLDASKQRSRDAQRIQTIRQVQNALELYRTDNGSYPTQNVSTANWPTGMTTILTGYISEISEDPSGLNIAYYGAPSDLRFVGCGEPTTGSAPLYDYLLTFETEGTLNESVPVLYTLSNPVDGTNCATNK